eukprot:TRINITY_DN703_c0_g1_i1.p2 TRINITY_DN703_c0_g1~~TRINITY_DN703_c0_g1_i1.p2  ORF type:complete len:523 (+),score=147.21 TRINITY_DN703_c0_g1_i1:435-2003(+)
MLKEVDNFNNKQTKRYLELKERGETISDLKVMSKMMEKMEWNAEENEFLSIENELKEMERERMELEEELEGMMFQRDQFHLIHSNKEQQRIQWEKSIYGKEYNLLLSQKRKLEQQNEEWKDLNHHLSIQSSILINFHSQKKEDDISGFHSIKQLERYEMENNFLLRNLRHFFQRQFKIQNRDSSFDEDALQDIFVENEQEMRRIRKMFKDIEMNYLVAEMEWIGLTTFVETVRLQCLDVQNGLVKDLVSDVLKNTSQTSLQNDENKHEINKLLSAFPSIFSELAQMQNVSVLRGDYQLKLKKLNNHLKKRKEFMDLLFEQLSCHRMCLFSVLDESQLVREDFNSLGSNLSQNSNITEDFLSHNQPISEFAQHNSNRQEILSLCNQSSLSHQSSAFVSSESNIQRCLLKQEDNATLFDTFERDQNAFLNSLSQNISSVQSQLLKTPLASSMRNNIWDKSNRNNDKFKNTNIIEHTHQQLDQMLKEFSATIIDIIDKRDTKIDQNESLERRTKLALMSHFYSNT